MKTDKVKFHKNWNLNSSDLETLIQFFQYVPFSMRWDSKPQPFDYCLPMPQEVKITFNVDSIKNRAYQFTFFLLFFFKF